MTQSDDVETGLFTVAIVGAGPAGTSLLERIFANLAEFVADLRVSIHLIDPHPPGGGRVWRAEQSDLMWANTPMAALTVFPDDTMECEGPTPPGPSMLDWVKLQTPEVLADPLLRLEAQRAHPGFFPSRRLLAGYLAWVFRRLTTQTPENVEIHLHTTRAVELVTTGTRTVIRLADGHNLTADAVALAQGHHDVDLAPPEQLLARFADLHQLTYLPAQYAADADLEVLAPGEPVIVRGLALSFVDYLVLLTEGRGGRYDRDGTGGLRYHPSGLEPVLFAGSRRGVPYRSKLGYAKLHAERPVARFLTPEVTEELIARDSPVEFGRDLGPLIRAEMAWAHYHELFNGHPERVRGRWTEVSGEFSLLSSPDPADAARVRALVARTVPAAEDRFDLAALEFPLTGVQVTTGEELQAWVCDHIAADLARRRNDHYSSDLAVFFAMMGTLTPIFRLLGSGRLSARSRTQELDPWFHNFFGYLGSGPPGPRAEQLLALARAGIVRFLGSGLNVTADEQSGLFRATSVNVPGGVEARALLEARLPVASVVRNRDPLIRRLYASGGCSEELLRDTPQDRAYGSGKLAVHETDQRVLDAEGRPHRALYAVGAWTAGFGPAGFPRLNPIGFMRTDSMVRALLRTGTETIREAGTSIPSSAGSTG